MFKEVNKVYQKIFETTQPSGFLWIPSGFHRPKKPCWVTRWFAGPSLQPNQPHQQLPLVQLAPPTKGTRHGSLPCMNFRGHPNDITSGVQTWPIPTSRLIQSLKTHRGWDFHLPTQPVCMLLLHLLLQNINCCTTDQASLHRHIWCSEIYWNTEMEAATSPVKHSTSQVVTPRALLQLVSRFCWRNKWTEEVRGGFSMFAAWCCKSCPTVGVTHDNGLNLACSTNDANHFGFGLVILICYTDIQS